MNDGVIYNVKTTIKSNTTNEKEISEIFNEKLLKIFLSLEKDNRNIRCQM